MFFTGTKIEKSQSEYADGESACGHQKFYLSRLYQTIKKHYYLGGILICSKTSIIENKGIYNFVNVLDGSMKQKILLTEKDYKYEQYFIKVLKRNDLKFHQESGEISFNYDYKFLLSKRQYFNECCDSELSPYKALTFLSI